MCQRSPPQQAAETVTRAAEADGINVPSVAAIMKIRRNLAALGSANQAAKQEILG